MKRIAIPVAFGLAVCAAVAAPADPAACDEKDRGTAASFIDRTSSSLELHDDGAALGGSRITVEVVSVDRSGNAITVRSTDAAEAGAHHTLPVQGAAVTGLEDLEAGDTVALTCRGAAEAGAAPALGDCTAVTSIRRFGTTASDFPSPPTLSNPKALAAVVVFADEGAQTLIVKDAALAAEEPHTLSVDAKAAAGLRDLRSGQEVRITCRESPNEPAASFGAARSVSDCASVTSVRKVNPDARVR